MKPLIVLISVFFIGLFIIKLRTKKTDWKLAGRIAMSAMLMFTAVAHFVFTDGMTQMIPDFFPLKKELVYVTGFLEFLFAVALLIPRTKTIAGWALIVFLLSILPANIKASIENINYQTGEMNGNGIEYLWFRIPLQMLFIAWVFFTVIKDFETNSTEI
ncbi:hypothetical protein [Maribacter sp. LLG6340-A2]|uniref:DoxX family protein n=1 Tax=Maribacter sp. LLG6340-A2 TaxID=3160834 RepID=UPI00386BAC43